MTSINEVKEIVEGLLRLQDKILQKEPQLLEEAKEEVGNVAQIEIYSLHGNYVERLKLDNGLKIVRTNEEPKHVIRMHIDTFIDLLIGERDGEPFDFGKAYMMGLIEFNGVDYHFHAMKWAKAFERLRKYINIGNIRRG